MAYFDDVRFPVDISYNASGGPRFRTDIIELASGAESRISRWVGPRREYDLAEAIKTRAEAATTLDFWLARKGHVWGFRFKDWQDFTSASDHISAPAFTDQVIGQADGSTRTFQLIKRYNPGTGYVSTRTITKPVEDTALLGVDGVQYDAGDFSVDALTGLVTFNTAPIAGDITAGFEFDTPVRFNQGQGEALRGMLAGRDSVHIESCTLIEEVDAIYVGEDFPYRGSKAWSAATDGTTVTVSLASGAALRFDSPTSVTGIILPDEDATPMGMPIFGIYNNSGHTITVYYDDGATVVGTVADGAVIEVWLTLDGSGDRRWILFG